MTEQELSTLIQSGIATLQQAAPTPAPALPSLDAATLATYIDHTLLKPEATASQIRLLCHEASTYGFASVCVNPTWVGLCAELLADSTVETCTVIGFPLGATLSTVKAYETEQVINLGASEVDMVVNIGQLKDQEWAAVYADIAAVVSVAHARAALVKVIIETALLNDEEKMAASLLTKAAGADFVKTSTGFSSGGATMADVWLMRRAIGPDLGLKAAGGIRSAQDAQQMIAAGATRLGASAGVKILQSLEANAPATEGSQGTGVTY